jgi:hypothetical protein
MTMASRRACYHELNNMKPVLANVEAGEGVAIVTATAKNLRPRNISFFRLQPDEVRIDRGYNVVANSRNISKSEAFKDSDRLALVDGNIGKSAVAAKIVDTLSQSSVPSMGRLTMPASSSPRRSPTTPRKTSRRYPQSIWKASSTSRRERSSEEQPGLSTDLIRPDGFSPGLVHQASRCSLVYL